MPFEDLQSFLLELERREQLRRVSAPVDPILEISEIADRVSKMPAAGGTPPPPTDPVHGGRGGWALLFENVEGSELPVAINTYGSYARVQLALGCESLEELAGRVEQLIKPDVPTSLLEKMKKLPDLARVAGYPPRIVRTGICQQVVHTDDADLGRLPIIQCWPLDAGRYITFGGMVTRTPETGDLNVGMYRAQVLGPQLMAMHWHMHHDGARNYRRYREAGERMPLAIVLGGESVLPYAATCPLPPTMSELFMAGFLNGRGLELVRCRTIPLEVPANAEIVIEGYIDPSEPLVREGPFGDHTGYYSLAGDYPAFHVTAITHRRDPVYPTTIVGPPPQEDYYLGKATERIFLPLLKVIIPDVIDYHLPMFGAFHNCVFLKIHKEYPMQARRVISAVWGAGQMAFSKIVIVVDDDINVHDEQEVLFHMCANVDPRRDIMIVDGPVDILDHAAPWEGAGSKMGIDATRKVPGEGTVREWPPRIRMSDEVRERVSRRWAEYGLDGLRADDT